MKNIVFVLSDMQFDNKNFVDIEATVKNQIELINFCRLENYPFILSEYKHRAKTVPFLVQSLKSLKKNKFFFIDKSLNSQLEEKRINTLLQGLSTKTVVLMGANACACILGLSINLLNQNYEIVISKDTITGYCSFHAENEIDKWYKENTIFFDNYNQVIDYIKKT